MATKASSRHKNFFIPTKIESVVSDLESFRALRSFCAHDLRSHIGAVTGLLQILVDEGQHQQLKDGQHLLSAFSAAQDALRVLDENLNHRQVSFKTVWLALGSQTLPPPVAQDNETGILFSQLSDKAELLQMLTHYRPNALVIDAEFIGSDSVEMFRRIGPQLVKVIPVVSAKQTALPSQFQDVPHLMTLPSPLTWELLLQALRKLF